MSEHLSCIHVAVHVLATYGTTEPVIVPCGVAPDRVYMAREVTSASVSSYLAFPSLPLIRRFISVALSLRSPSAAVSRYPAL